MRLPSPALTVSAEQRIARWSLAANLWTFVAIVLAGGYGLFVARVHGEVATIWPASAVAFAAVATRGWRTFPAIALGSFTVARLDGRSTLISLALMLPVGVEIALAMTLVLRTRFDLRFRRPGAPVQLLWIAGLAALAGAATGVTVLLLGGDLPISAALTATVSWTLGDALGILVFAPAFLLWIDRRFLAMRPQGMELTALAIVTIGVGLFPLLSFSGFAGYRTLTTLLALFPLMLWTSLRADLRVATAVVVVLSIAGTLGVRFGTGALVSADSVRGVINVQTFHVLMVLIVLVGSASSSQREDTLARISGAERTLALVFSGTPDAHALYSVSDRGELRLATANRVWREGVASLGADVTDDAIIGKTVDELQRMIRGDTDRDSSNRSKLEEVARTGQPLRYEAEIMLPQGPRAIETALVPLKEGERTAYVLATSRDLTESRLSQQRLRESELRFAAVSDATAEVHMLFAVGADRSMRLVHLNRAAIGVWEHFWPGSSRRDIIGRPASDILTMLPGFTHEMFVRNLQFAEQAITTGQALRYEDELVTELGRRVAEVAMTPIMNERGEVTHVLRSSLDITPRKDAEQSARRFNEALEQRVAERTAQLANVNRELQAFGYTLSHDLRAPLRSVEGFSRAMLEDLEQGHPEELRAHAERISAAAQRMKRLVDDLLRLSQLDTAELDRTPVNIGRMATEILGELQRSDPHRIVTMRIGDGLEAVADTQLVFIALQNLLDNAWKYTARTTDAVIEVGRCEGTEPLTIFVRDNGAGFDPRYAGRLFAPFERLHKREEFEGAGIGLATVQRIISAHGGRVWAEGKPGHGATFFFTLAPATGALTV